MTPSLDARDGGTPNPASPFVSVLIPVLDDVPGLAKCLSALAEQTYPRSRYEVIVVDNGSWEDVSHVVERFAGVKLLVEARKGTSVARNTGIVAAKGDVLAFTDADCVPAARWLECGVKEVLAIENCGLVGGRVTVTSKRSGLPSSFVTSR